MHREEKIELAKMQSLMERMDKHYTKSQSDVLLENVLIKNNVIKESIDEVDARDRKDVEPSEFFDMVSQMKGGTKASIGYISAANLKLPQVKKINPETNRMKNYDDYDTFGKELGVEDEIAGVIKFGCYTLNWRSPENMRKHYNVNYVDKVNAIRDEIGVPHMKRREPYTQTLDYGNGVSAYSGENDALNGHSYSPQDLGKATKDVKYYLIGTNGNIIKEVTEAELKPYFKGYTVDGIKALRDLQKSDEEIEAYAKRVAELNFRYTRFEHSSIVFVITTVGGEKKRFFNKNLVNSIKGINVNQEEILNIAKQKYKVADEQIKDTDVSEFDDEFTDYAD